MSDSSRWMQAAIQEAFLAQGPCHPNPAVGAVIVHGGKLVASGHTQPPGSSHAEIMALRQFAEAGLRPDATTCLYVTLEPCSTTGRTGACTDAIIASGIRKVVVGATDPHRGHAGNGFAVLRTAGIEVENGVLESECRDLNPVFHHWQETGQVLMAAKIATTIDGKVATRNGHSRWITGEAARQDVARWRRAFPAIAVGGGTILRDNPMLTARVEGEPDWCPRRMIFDRKGLCLEQKKLNVFSDAYAARTIYVTDARLQNRVPPSWRGRGVEVWEFEDWHQFRARCLQVSLTGVYVEGGPRLLSDLFRSRQVDYLFAYRAPLLLGDVDSPGPFAGMAPDSMERAIRLRSLRLEQLGEDQLMRGFVHYPKDSE